MPEAWWSTWCTGTAARNSSKRLERDGPYNTRLNRGLPPTPIGNPGLASLRAAVKPAGERYLFYVRKPGKSGEHAFSSTDAQFQRDVAKYQKSRAGG